MTVKEAREYIIRHCNPDYPKGKTEWETALNMAIDALSEQPTVEERKKGKWIRKSPTAWMWTCSCCEKDDAYAYSADDSFEPVLQDLYCPNCGADMRGSENE